MKTAILLSIALNPEMKARIQAGTHPQQDYYELQEALHADIIAPMTDAKRMRKLPKLLRFAAIAWAGFRKRNEYDVIISDLDRPGMMLALLLKLTWSRTRHVVICHGKIATKGDLFVLKMLGLKSHIHRFICYGPAVERRLESTLGLPEGIAVTVLHPVDHRFWHPLPVTPEKLIVSAGMAWRDYPTLVEAVRGMDVSLIIAGWSPWVDHTKTGIHPDELPPNVQLTRGDYAAMRELYARALFVAVPLTEIHGQSGSLVMYEAMSMGKAVIATRTEGQESMQILTEGETGAFVPVGDVQGWRDQIQFFCDHPEAAKRMGDRARQIVEDGMSLSSYAREMAVIVASLHSERITAESGEVAKRSA